MKTVSADELDLRWEPETKGITWKICDGAETLREFGPIVQQIYGTDLSGLRRYIPPKFQDPTWKTIFVRGSAYTSDCTYGYDPDVIFAGRDHLEPLWRILEKDGTDEVIITEEFHPSQFTTGIRTQWQDTIVCAPTREIVRTAINASAINYQFNGADMFSRDGRWISSCDHDDFGVLGGEPELIDRFISYYGGLDLLQEITADEVSDRLEEKRKYGVNYEELREFWRNVYAQVDWPWPEELNEI